MHALRHRHQPQRAGSVEPAGRLYPDPEDWCNPPDRTGLPAQPRTTTSSCSTPTSGSRCLASRTVSALAASSLANSRSRMGPISRRTASGSRRRPRVRDECQPITSVIGERLPPLSVAPFAAVCRLVPMRFFSSKPQSIPPREALPGRPDPSSARDPHHLGPSIDVPGRRGHRRPSLASAASGATRRKPCRCRGVI